MGVYECWRLGIKGSEVGVYMGVGVSGESG